jgi:hypothetical protein
MIYSFITRLGTVILISLLLITLGHAHTDNEASLFPDISDHESRYDILMLAAMGIIPESDKFQPDEVLPRRELAVWGMLAARQGVMTETDKAQLAELALRQNIIDSLEGDASYKDINNVLFRGKLVLEQADANPTRAEAVSFIIANLQRDIEGGSLLSKLGMQMGPQGKIDKVESKLNPDGSSTYYVTIAGITNPFYSHGKVANGPVDVGQWQDREIEKSVVRELAGFKLWIYLEAKDMVHSTDAH